MNDNSLWRSLDEVTGDGDAFVARPLPLAATASADDDTPQPVKRRAFLQVLGALLTMGMGCTKQPEERIVPHVRAPEGTVPGMPLFYATATVLGGVATGVLVEQNEGRPTKIEGNPEHPASLGGTDAFMQAATFDLYDPDRSKTLTHLGAISNYGALVGALQKEMLKFRSRRGEGLRILTTAVGSPTLKAQIDGLLEAMPLAKWHWYEPVFRRGAREGAKLALGTDLEPRYDLSSADVVVCLDADLFGAHEGRLAYARQFALRRQPHGTPLRLYAFEPTPSITGSKADHRFAVRADAVEGVARTLASLVGANVPRGEAPAGVAMNKLEAVARDLKKAAGRSVVVAGDFQPASVHALALAINHALDNFGKTVFVGDPVLYGDLDPVASIAELAADMDQGKVELLLILGGNPVFDAPADVSFLDRLKKVPLRVHLGRQDDETAGFCHWHVPEAHSLESWSDGRAFDGTVTVIQPLIAPLYGAKSAHELLISLSDKPDRSARDLVKETLLGGGAAGEGGEAFFRRALHDGFAAPPAPPRGEAPELRPLEAAKPLPDSDLEIVFRPDTSTWDGRFAGNAWLQELPRPLTKITWDNAAMLSTEDAKRLGLANGDLVELSVDGRSVTAPVWVMPGQAAGSVAVHLGYGRKRGSRIAVGVGFDAQALRTTAAPWNAGGLALKKVGAGHEFATTQGHHRTEGRDIIRSARFGEHKTDKHHEGKHHLSLYPDEFKYATHAWGMAINLATCIGCNACVTACQAENNVPVVGKEQVLRSREMHWLRIDRYYEGPAEEPVTHFQPLPCMQCENAPCEVVCPVQATVHSSEGLNDMVYNRCVGTKYCSNNCPYKVRRYNFFGFSVDDTFGLDMKAPSVALMHNPDVTVRTYGVMEKCTYCVQRIVAGRIEAKKEDRRVRDGEVMTACQAACPTRAITFGDLNDKSSAVAHRRAEERNYELLGELNTHPRTTYLAALSNPNPEIVDLGGAPPEGHEGH